METITGSNGIIIPPEGYLAGVRKICDEFGIMMICDEVMAGFGRTGKMFAFENFGVKPDIVSFAKGVTCGYVQLGGVAVSKKIADYFDDNVLQCGLTYSGHPLACAAGVACLNYYKLSFRTSSSGRIHGFVRMNDLLKSINTKADKGSTIRRITVNDWGTKALMVIEMEDDSEEAFFVPVSQLIYLLENCRRAPQQSNK